MARAEAEIGLTTLFESLPQLSLTDEPVQYADDMVFHVRSAGCSGPDPCTSKEETS